MAQQRKDKQGKQTSDRTHTLKEDQFNPITWETDTGNPPGPDCKLDYTWR